MNLEQQTTDLTNDIKNLIVTAQEKAIRVVDYQTGVNIYFHKTIKPFWQVNTNSIYQAKSAK